MTQEEIIAKIGSLTRTQRNALDAVGHGIRNPVCSIRTINSLVNLGLIIAGRQESFYMTPSCSMPSDVYMAWSGWFSRRRNS